MRFKFILGAILLLTTCVLKAQELPPIETYLPNQYEAENQNWSISQSQDKYIYVANNKGLLEFNGAKWQLYLSPNQSIIRSVNVINSRIYTGCYMDFGYWEKDGFGDLFYTSLAHKNKLDLIEDEQFWNIVSVDEYILFQSLNRIYIYNPKDNSFRIINSPTTITKVYKVENQIYFQNLDEGVFIIENGISKLLIQDAVVKTNVIVNIFKHNGNLLIQTQESGFYEWSNGNLQKWETASTDAIDQLSVYSSIQLSNGSFMCGTISNGIIHISDKGEFIYKIDQTQGLANNTVLSMYEDVEHNIWLGLDNGINCINTQSPFIIYNDDSGELGTVYASVVYHNNLFLGTNQGLFYKPIDSKGHFSFIEGTKGQVWCLVVIDETLFCGHNIGTFIIDKNNNAEIIADTPGTWSVKQMIGKENLLLQGNYNGLNVLEKKNDKWTFRNKIKGFDMSSKYFEVQNKNQIFVSHEYKGVFEIKVDDSLSQVSSVTKNALLKRGVNASLLKHNGEILYAYKGGVFGYNADIKNFVKDSVLSGMVQTNQYTSGKLISDSVHNKLWSFSNRQFSYLSTGGISKLPKIETIALPKSLRKEMVGYENISYLNDNRYIFGTSTGYMIVDLDKLGKKKYTVSINQITNFAIDGDVKKINGSDLNDFNNKDNNIGFTFSVAEYDKYQETEYQFQLIGFYEEWSSWSDQPSVLFKNLPFGDYVFNVRARVGNTITDNVATVEFGINKPWYQTNVMIGLYLLMVILFSLFMHNYYKRYYKKQREKLLVKNKQDLELKELENEQHLMLIKNEKLQQDIDNKNRELAISTMSLIKKNEFLNNIKEELKNTGSTSNLKPVIKIIDNNLNNTDDWKFFQEAFNNADKDFLKKVKTLHPSLTPNDLKLCAYLRLNLSSKEIAPLLNISSKSVEVKRYRLRKKMDLPHEYSLTNYILEI